MARIWAGGISVSDFAKRRLRRILPMLFVTVLVCIPFALWLMGRSAQNEFGADAVASTLLVPNIFYGFQDSYWAAPGKLRPLLHLWTIGVEMQFYMLCPLIFLALKKWAKPVVTLSVITAASIAAAILLSRSAADVAFYNLPTRLWEFGLGALIFYSPLEKLKSPAIWGLGLALILCSFLVLNEAIAHPSLLTLIPVLGACLVIAGHRGGKDNIILANPVLRRIGIISFSAYLIHQPLFAFTRIALNSLELTTLMSLTLIGITLMLSELTYRFIETPLRIKGKGRTSLTALLGIAALMGGLFMQFGTSYKANTEALLIKPERWILNAADTLCISKEIDHPCRLGNSKIPPSIALLGDSHIQAMTGGLDEFFNAQGLNDIDYSMSGCPFIMGVRRYARKYPCDEFVEDVFEQLAERNIKTVLILDRRNAYLRGKGAIYDDGTEEPYDLRIYPVEQGQDGNPQARIAEIERLHLATIKRLQEMGLKIVMIYPLPAIGIHVPDTLPARIENNNLPLTLNRDLHEAAQRPLTGLKALLANEKNILEIDPADIFCDFKNCRTHDSENIYYTDRDHLSREGTELLLEAVGSDILDFIYETP